MEQLYMLELFVDSVTVRPSKDDYSGSAKKLIVKLRFGPKLEFIINENHINPNDIILEDVNEGNSWRRLIRIGKSYLFSSFPDILMSELEKFPLEVELWTDDTMESPIFIGLGTMKWNTKFYDLLSDNYESNYPPKPMTIQESVILNAECCCRSCGEITLILRLSCLGQTVETEFQQLMTDPKSFVLRTDRASTTLQCKRHGSDLNFLMIGSLYETTTLEAAGYDKIVEVCTAADCGKLDDETMVSKIKELKIRMGDITGPCGNPNCPLAIKIKQYIRKLDLYKKSIGNQQLMSNKEIKDKLICGKCICKDERYHRDTCPTKNEENVGVCINCAGYVEYEKVKTCEREKCIQNANPTIMQCTINNYKDNINNFQKVCGIEHTNKFLPNNKRSVSTSEATQLQTEEKTESFKLCFDSTTQINKDIRFCLECGTKTSICSDVKSKDYTSEVFDFNNAVHNNYKQNLHIYNCTTEPDDNTCKCEPIKPNPPCDTFDCTCIAKAEAKISRKLHKPYCPSYKHKASCPVTRTNSNENALVKSEDNEDENEPLPYGLPPIKLGPCPVLGKPCTQQDGFAKMYKTAALPELPKSYSDAGKVCCSKEFERIKKAMNELMTNELMNDCQVNCVKAFLQDNTEARCCDKNEASEKLIGKSCCAAHKLALLEKFEKQ